MEHEPLMDGHIKQCTTSAITREKEQAILLEMILQDTNKDLHRLNLTIYNKQDSKVEMTYPNNYHDIQTVIINQIPIRLISLGSDGVLFVSIDEPRHDISFFTTDWSFV